MEGASVGIGRNIAGLRQAKNLTQRELAEKAGISVSYLKKIEEGYCKRPHLKVLVILAASLEVGLIKILGDG